MHPSAMMPVQILWAACVTLISLGQPAIEGYAGPVEIRVDASRVIGKVRPLHGVNNGPLNYGEFVDVSEDYRELAPPLARLHDSEWPNPDVVDMHAVFPDPAADPEDPANYRFSRSDDYIQAIVNAGTGLVYRLGESIEHSRKKYHVHPPADCDRWAAACLGIIRHYNEGWAEGFHHDIRYWEIWNEPENRPAMWTGSDAEYYQLYVTASRTIKGKFPRLLVGGPSVGATGEIVDGRWRPNPFLEGFLAACREHSAPLDFFSWHTYTDDPGVYVLKARAIRKWLDTHGFSDTEIHLNEWNYLPDNDWTPHTRAAQGIPRERWFGRIGGAEGAAFLASVLIGLQDAPVDVANYYSGDTLPFGLFSRHGVRKKTFFAMKAFTLLLRTPRRVSVQGERLNEVAVCAGIHPEQKEMTVLLSNLRSKDSRFALIVDPLPWKGPTSWELLILDKQQDLKPVASGAAEGGRAHIPCDLKAPGLAVIRLTKPHGSDP